MALDEAELTPSHSGGAVSDSHRIPLSSKHGLLQPPTPSICEPIRVVEDCLAGAQTARPKTAHQIQIFRFWADKTKFTKKPSSHQRARFLRDSTNLY